MPSESINLRPLWQKTVLLVLGYAACAGVSKLVSNPHSQYISIWLPAGIYVAGLLLVETKDWIPVVLAISAVDIGSDLLKGSPVLLSLLICGANSASAVAGASLFRRFVARTTRLSAVKDLFYLLACTSAAGAALGATLGAAIVVGYGFNPSYIDSWTRWWIANAMAILLVTPLVLVWSQESEGEDGSWRRPGRWIEAAFIASGLLTMSWMLIVRGSGILGPNKSLLVLFILWAAMRFGLRAATVTNVLFALLVTFMTSHYAKGLSAEQIASGSYIPSMQLSLAITAFVGLVPCIVLAERERAVQQLEHSENRYRSVIEGSPESITVLRSGTIVYANPAACRMFGATSAGELIGKPMINRVHPSFRETVMARRKHLEDHGFGGPMAELKYLKLDGAPIDVEVQSVSVLYDGETCTQITSRDIGRRKKAEEALKLSEFSVRHASVPTFWIGSDARILRVNRAACELLGFSEEELLALAITDIDPDSTPEGWPSHWQELRERKRMRFETRHRHKAGHILTVDADLNWFEFDGREYNFAFVHDITERKRVEAGLRESEGKLRAVFEGSKDAIGVSKCGIHVFANPAYIRLFGFESNEKIVGTSVIDSIAPSHKETLKENIRRRAAGEPVPRFYLARAVKVDGTEFDAEFSISTYEMNGEIYSVAHIRDITERRLAEEARARLEEQLRQSQKHEAIGTLASGIAHDFNNILAGIYGFTALARESAGANAELRDYLDEISKAGHRAKELVRQILAFSRKGSGDEPMGPVQLGNVVAEAVKLLRASTPSTIEFTQELETGLPLAHGSATQLHQVVLNLGTNAVQAMGERPGRLTIALGACALDEGQVSQLTGLKPGRFIRLSVSDTGIGMDKETQARVFEPFFTTKGPGEGTGLGLSVVYGIVRNHQGAIRLESEVDRGTTFEIFLPIAVSAKAEGTQEPLAMLRGDGERILFVDDERPIVRVGELTLRRLGYDVDSESQGQLALARVEREAHAYRLVIADQTMPGMTGLELASRIRSLCPDLPVVLTSGHSSALTPEHVAGAGVKEVLAKPYTAEMLASAVRRHIVRGPSRRQE